MPKMLGRALVSCLLLMVLSGTGPARAEPVSRAAPDAQYPDAQYPDAQYPDAQYPDAQYAADIRYSQHGVPHIRAADFRSLGFGFAYAFAENNVCLMAEQYLTLRGERARYFGRDGFFRDTFAEALGERVGNVDSDFYHKFVFADVGARQREGAGREVQQLLTGYVAGYNRFLTDHPGACDNAEWVRPISEEDAYRRILQSQLLGGSGTFVKPIADAMTRVISRVPARQAAAVHGAFHHASLSRQARDLGAALSGTGIGSNAIAFGRDTTPEGAPMLFGNPHFPWSGAERLYQMHLTIPGAYDVMGAALYGIPFPQIGFSTQVAWSVTWSTDTRFLVRDLKLNRKDPTQYLVDGQLHAMKAFRIAVEVRNADGSRVTEHRIAYRTAYGPLIAGKYFPRSRTRAYAFTDLNLDNNRGAEAYFQITRARNVEEIDASQNRLTGLPYSNVTAVDSNGRAYFSNKSVAANVPDAQIERCLKGQRAKLYRDNFAVLILDGSASACSPKSEAAAAQPGILPAQRKPFLFRTDYTAQTNDSHWIVNADPSSFLTGFGFVVGRERTARSERMRVAARFIKDRLSGADGLPGARFTPEHMRGIFYRARLVEAELMKRDLVADCERHPKMRISWTLTWVDVSETCKALRAWDATEGIDSRGGHVFRMFYDNLLRANGALNPKVWRTAFNPVDPLATPNGMRPSRLTRSALAKATQTLRKSGLSPDARLGDIQFTVRNGRKIPLSGGRGFHRLRTTFVPGVGYTDPVISGDSYIQSVALDRDGPRGYVVNAYSQSTDPKSAHAHDQTLLYSAGDWPVIRFTDDQIVSDPGYRLVRITQ